jgi:hypothetical protein
MQKSVTVVGPRCQNKSHKPFVPGSASFYEWGVASRVGLPKVEAGDGRNQYQGHIWRLPEPVGLCPMLNCRVKSAKPGIIPKVHLDIAPFDKDANGIFIPESAGFHEESPAVVTLCIDVKSF